jgi:N utilization substance protein A
MGRKEQSRLESFAVGERVRVVLVRVEKASKGPQVVVSRAAPELVQNLFQTEVPEIYDNTVVIRAIAREAGERTKIAVMSRDKDVDSVGACVGMKGMRVQSIIRELRGEKIDIIEFSDDPVQFATHALSPAKISRVTILDPVEHHMEVIVDDSQLSLAIGKKGQNVRLAAKLLGWKIDIKSEEEKRQEVQSAIEALSTGAPVSVLIDYGLAESTIDALVKGDIGTVEKLGNMTPEQLEALEGIDEDTVNRIQQAINSYYGQEYGEPAQQGEASEAQEGEESQGQQAEGSEAWQAEGDALESESEQAEGAGDTVEAVAESDGLAEEPAMGDEAVTGQVTAEPSDTMEESAETAHHAEEEASNSTAPADESEHK